MNARTLIQVSAVSAALVLLFFFSSALANDRLTIISELTGFDAHRQAVRADCRFSDEHSVYLCPKPVAGRRPAAAGNQRAQAIAALNDGGLLLIPNSTLGQLMAFDPHSGELIDEAFLVLDEEDTGTVIHALMRPNGNILISDQTRNVVHQYNLDGDYLGVFAPAGGANTNILQNIRGIALRENGHVLVTVGGGNNADAVAEFDENGNYLGNFIANGSGGLQSPFDIYQRGNSEWLVSSINTNQILRYGPTGEPVGVFGSINSFPQQIFEQSGGEVLVGNFSGTQTGVVEFESNGTLIDVYNPDGVSSYRGVRELGNGNILTATSGGVFEIDHTGQLVETHYVGVGRFIEFATLAEPLELRYTVGPFVDFDTCPEGSEIDIGEGEIVAYCFLAQNNSDQAWSLHDLIDSEQGELFEGLAHNLMPGNFVFLVLSEQATETTIREATWTAYNPGPTDVTSSTASVTVNVVPPSIELEMTLDYPHDPKDCGTESELAVLPGSVVGVCYRITNTGLTTLRFHDLEASAHGEILDGFAFELQPGATVFVTLGHQVNESAVLTGIWTAYNEGPAQLVQSSASASVIMLDELFSDRFEQP